MTQIFREVGVPKIYSRQLKYTKSRALVILQAVYPQYLKKVSSKHWFMALC